MIIFGTLFPLLFTAPSLHPKVPLRTSSTKWLSPRSNPTTSSLSSSTFVEDNTKTEEKEDKSINRIMSEINEMYDKLTPSSESHKYSPTLTFSYVAPPSSNNDDTTPPNPNNPNPSQPIALYLPGLDGTGISASIQFPDLSRTFELWRMTVDRQSDRSSFGELVDAASRFVWDVAGGKVGRSGVAGREVVLIGESFGGLLAPAVALRVAAMCECRTGTVAAAAAADDDGEERIRNPVSGMVLVNPATSFDETNWDTLGPLLTSLRHLESPSSSPSPLALPTPYSVLGGMALSALVPDSTQFRRILSTFTSVEVDLSVEGIGEVLAALRDGFGILAENLPAEVVEHRVGRWLPVGAMVVNDRLEGIEVPTLVVAGEDDNMLPTKEEAKRLSKLMPNCTTTTIRGAGHLVLDDRVNLTELILLKAPFRSLPDTAPLRPIDEGYDPVRDWTIPSESTIREAIENRVEPTRRMASPVFFSCDGMGRRYVGLGQLPRGGGGENGDGGPLLFVGNHQFLGMDLGMMIAELVEERGMFPRGLAHPVVFGAGAGADGANGGGGFGGGNGGGQGGGQMGDFRTFGAVMVTPKNYYRLMSTNQNALLFPGGVREVFHNKDEAYQLFWPDDADNDDDHSTSRSDFVRTAAKFNATIIPFSAVGAFDSYNILAQPRDVADLPFGLGDRAKNFTNNVVAARFDRGKEEESFLPPLAVPKPLQARHYFVFGTPVKTDGLDSRDREGCRRVYKEVKAEVKRGLEDLVVAREKDPFVDNSKRLGYEALWGKKAPTFPVEELNR